MIEQKIQRIIDVKDWDLFRGIYNALTFEQLQQINGVTDLVPPNKWEKDVKMKIKEKP